MVRSHPSTPDQRAQWTADMLAHQGEYGVVTRVSRTSGVSRPTLYAWRDQAQQALVRAFTPPVPRANLPSDQARQILTAWIIHAGDRGIQIAMRELAHQKISLDTITMVLADAAQRARVWMQCHMPTTRRALALDEIYANDRHGAYLNVVDVHSGAVWASEGPLAVDADSWTLVLWSLQERGLHWDRVVLDGGAAMRAACRTVTPDLLLQGDQWHVLHTCAQVQARLDRRLRDLDAQTRVVDRQAARVAAGQRPVGRRPKTDAAAHAQDVASARRVADAVRYLTGELHRLLAVVVLDRRGRLDASQRQTDLDALLTLLAEVSSTAPAPQRELIAQLQTTLQDVMPQLLTFVRQVDQVQHDLQGILVPARQALLGWAWLRRRTLGWTSTDILTAIPDAWRAAARVLLATWDDAVRVSSAVERWHSIMRPHLAVRRTLTTGMLALLAVWHNHRVFTRGIHKGQSPLHLSGMTDAPIDWLVALGYPSLMDGPLPVVADLALVA
jgi:transposase-like protein